MLCNMPRILRRAKFYLLAFFNWTIRAVAIGAACGAAGAAFRYCVDRAGALFGQYEWLLYLLPIAGIVIVWLYHAAGILQDQGTNLVLISLQNGTPVAFRVAPLIFLSTVLTHLCGGSAGREGAALQIGAGLSSCFNRVFRLEGKEARAGTMCGMSALFAAVFGMPVTAAVLSLEVGTVGVLRYASLYPCLLSACTAWGISQLLGSSSISFSLHAVPDATISTVFRVVLLTLLCALCSILFLAVLHRTEKLYRRLFVNPYLRILAGGCLVAVLTLLLGDRDYNGAGMGVVAEAIGGEAVPWAFLVKILLTALTIGAGYKGGEIVPAFFIGATFGCTAGPLLGLDPGFSAAIGMVALFCCVLNCPMASIVLSVELFGGEAFILFALTCGLSYLMSGYYTLYDQQRIVYSKLVEEPEE